MATLNIPLCFERPKKFPHSASSASVVIINSLSLEHNYHEQFLWL